MLKTESETDARPFTAPWYVMPKKPAAVAILWSFTHGVAEGETTDEAPAEATTGERLKKQRLREGGEGV